MKGVPLIGVTTSATADRDAGKAAPRAHLNRAYIVALQQAGGAPVLLPPYLEADALEALWKRLDGLVLTGGGDIDPTRYGEPAHPGVSEVSAARDALELDLVTRALERDLPLLAICRGIQVLNVALGGSLYQDIPSEPRSPIAHTQKDPREQPTHPVKVMGEGARLGAVLGALELDVNSFHHQAIKRLGGGLREVAWAPDGIIEGVETLDRRDFALGVQWHPEDLVGRDRAARNLFAALVDAARARSRR